MDSKPERRAFLSLLASAAAASSQGAPVVTRQAVQEAARTFGLTITDAQADALIPAISQFPGRCDALHRVTLDNGVAPPFHFNPLLPGMTVDRVRRPIHPSPAPKVTRPENLEDAAFWPVTHLGALVRSRQVTSIELTRMYLGRLKRLNPKLLCAVNLTEERALRQARLVDQELAAGRYRGPLHGIPCGVKDIIAAKGYPTTWGAAPFKDRVIDGDATVVARLEAAGAVLIAKLATGELALDDEWFAGQTRNPWDLSMGSQGSSAGPGSATAAGLVGFSIGTETGGSIVEPSGICGVTGFRPTFGRVSRHGAMTLSWSLDKIGPMCRSVEDCALVLSAIQGPDDKDLSVQDIPFNWNPALDIRNLRVGFVKAAFSNTRQTPKTDANDAAALEKLRSLGITLREIALPEQPALDFRMIIYGEGAPALKNPVETQPAGLVRQDRVIQQNAYRLLPAADYLDANRLRTLLMREMAGLMADIDVYVVPFDYADYTPNPSATWNTTLTNLTGQPCVVVPHGFNEKGNPTSLTFIGRVFGDAEMLALARAYQDATGWHLKHPVL